MALPQGFPATHSLQVHTGIFATFDIPSAGAIAGVSTDLMSYTASRLSDIHGAAPD